MCMEPDYHIFLSLNALSYCIGNVNFRLVLLQSGFGCNLFMGTQND